MKEKLNKIFSDIDFMLDYREQLLRKDTLTNAESTELNLLNDFVYRLPIGSTHNEIKGFQKLREFAENIGKQID